MYIKIWRRESALPLQSMGHPCYRLSIKVLLLIGHNASSKLLPNFFFFYSEVTEKYCDEYLEHQFVPLAKRTRPPRLLICYLSSDGSAHVRVVLQLATFMQKHMATEVKKKKLNQLKYLITFEALQSSGICD